MLPYEIQLKKERVMQQEIKRKYKEINVMSVGYLQRKYKVGFKEASELLVNLCTNKCEKVYDGKSLVQIYR